MQKCKASPSVPKNNVLASTIVIAIAFCLKFSEIDCMLAVIANYKIKL